MVTDPVDQAWTLAARMYEIACSRTNQTQRELAVTLGRSRTTISDWRLGNRDVPLQEVLKVCKVAGIWPDELAAIAVVENPNLLAALPDNFDIDHMVGSLSVMKSLMDLRKK